MLNFQYPLDNVKVSCIKFYVHLNTKSCFLYSFPFLTFNYILKNAKMLHAILDTVLSSV